LRRLPPAGSLANLRFGNSSIGFA